MFWNERNEILFIPIIAKRCENELPTNHPWKHVVGVNILTPICCDMFREIKTQVLLLLYKLISRQKIIEAHVSVIYHSHSLQLSIVLLAHRLSFDCLIAWLVFVSANEDFKFIKNSHILYGEHTLNLDYIICKILVTLKASSQICTARQ